MKESNFNVKFVTTIFLKVAILKFIWNQFTKELNFNVKFVGNHYSSKGNLTKHVQSIHYKIKFT